MGRADRFPGRQRHRSMGSVCSRRGVERPERRRSDGIVKRRCARKGKRWHGRVALCSDHTHCRAGHRRAANTRRIATVCALVTGVFGRRGIGAVSGVVTVRLVAVFVIIVCAITVRMIGSRGNRRRRVMRGNSGCGKAVRRRDRGDGEKRNGFAPTASHESSIAHYIGLPAVGKFGRRRMWRNHGICPSACVLLAREPSFRLQFVDQRFHFVDFPALRFGDLARELADARIGKIGPLACQNGD